MSIDHNRFMDIALEDARSLIGKENTAVTSIVVREGEVIGRGANRVYSQCDTTAHAEILAIRDSCATLNKPVLSGCTLYTTFEPCPMCCWAILNSGIEILVMGARFAQFKGDRNLGGYCVESLMDLTGRKIELVTGVRPEECGKVWRLGIDNIPSDDER